MNVNDETKSALLEDIKNSFNDVAFPSHLGLHAALAKDNWIKDVEQLKKITLVQDFNGDWIDVPEEHLEKGWSLAPTYLDSVGVAYYLPAYMVRALNEPTPKKLSTVLTFVDPTPYRGNELYNHFCERFSLFGLRKKKACKNFLIYMKSLLQQAQKSTSIIDEILSHEFWASV
ncbi:DUF6714 family protein [Aliikangiella sp. IMCC44653]